MTSRFDELLTLVNADMEAMLGLPVGSPVYAACSGGADSVALVALLSAQQAYPLRGVCYVDHGLRDASIEERMAKEAAERAGVEFVVLRIKMESGGNIQARARAARYEALEKQVPAGAFIATGHTQSDQAETVLQRVLRGAGRRGLSAIYPQRGRILRPMLRISREETRRLGLPFADDPSNAGDAYQRNRIRHAALDVLREENPNIELALSHVASQARGEWALLEHVLEKQTLRMEEIVKLGVAATATWMRFTWPELATSARSVVNGLAHAACTSGEYGPIRLDSEQSVAFTQGKLVIAKSPDPRMRVVASAPGAYPFRGGRLVIKLGTIRQQEQEALFSLALDSTTLTWPITLQTSNATQSMGLRGKGSLKYRLSDGSGDLVWQSGMSQSTKSSGRDLHIALFVC